jgi:hypothetical protein
MQPQRFIATTTTPPPKDITNKMASLIIPDTAIPQGTAPRLRLPRF